MQKNIIHYYEQLFNFKEIDIFFKEDAIIDAKQGGILLGPSHDEGGICFLQECHGGFKVYGEVEGYEFIINRRSNESNCTKLELINNIDRDFFDDFKPYTFSKAILTINAASPDPDKYKCKYIILDFKGGESVINKYSTKKYLEEINKINKSY